MLKYHYVNKYNNIQCIYIYIYTLQGISVYLYIIYTYGRHQWTVMVEWFLRFSIQYDLQLCHSANPVVE